MSDILCDYNSFSRKKIKNCLTTQKTSENAKQYETWKFFDSMWKFFETNYLVKFFYCVVRNNFYKLSDRLKFIYRKTTKVKTEAQVVTTTAHFL
uniref:Uncharacterized protein n=1 Tax=Romanomermis culicivorax TaxID=13658 RepID=A0A915JAT5_ROMCU